MQGAATAITKRTRAKYPGASAAFHSGVGLSEKYAESGQINAHDTNATIRQMLPPSGIHSRKERMAFELLHSSF